MIQVQLYHSHVALTIKRFIEKCPLDGKVPFIAP